MASTNLPNGTGTVQVVPKTVIFNTGESGIELTFINGHTTLLGVNRLVKLNSVGAVVPVTAATDFSVGTVIVDAEPNDYLKVNVKSPFKQIVTVETSAAITAGNFLTTAAYSTTNECNIVTVAGSNNFAMYVALETVTAAAGTVLIAGELMQPFKV
jgi:hypothetical protein